MGFKRQKEGNKVFSLFKLSHLTEIKLYYLNYITVLRHQNPQKMHSGFTSSDKVTEFFTLK